MQQLVQNLLNGNLTDAKTQAKRYRLAQIVNHLHYMCGWSADRSNKAAVYLKTGEGWQQYCDAR